MVKCIEEYIQVADFKMYTKIFQGKKKQPVIILESGYGDYSKAWNQTAEELTEYGTVLDIRSGRIRQKREEFQETY